MATHEDFRTGAEPQPPSDRSFGLVFGGFFCLIALWPVLHGRALRPWALGVGLAFLVLAFLRPSLLHGANGLWFRLALLLNRVVTPVVTTLLFYLVFTPLGLVLKMGGKDPLRLRRDAAARTYWIERQPPGPEPESMVEQF